VRTSVAPPRATAVGGGGERGEAGPVARQSRVPAYAAAQAGRARRRPVARAGGARGSDQQRTAASAAARRARRRGGLRRLRPSAPPAARGAAFNCGSSRPTTRGATSGGRARVKEARRQGGYVTRELAAVPRGLLLPMQA
jgi:hypothetical protein